MESKEIQVFRFSDSEMRTITTPTGDVYFVAQDVCKLLELENVSKAVSRLDDDEKTTLTLSEYGRDYEKPVINESGLYSLVLSSRKPEAKAFKKWVTAEVLPAIRKTGRYQPEPAKPRTQIQMLADAANAMVLMEQKMENLEQENVQIKDQMAHLAGKIEDVNPDYYALAGYYKAKKQTWKMPNAEAIRVGKALTQKSKELGYPVGKIQSQAHGAVNTYHTHILSTVLGF